MAANVNSFLANFTGGGARANRYEVIIGFPNFLNIRDTAVQQKISFTCKAASIPASELGEAVVPYKGRQIKVPGDRTFGDWTVTIVIDNDFKGRDVFESWSSGMLGNSSNLTKSANELNPLQIYGQAQVNLLDRYDQVLKRYQITGMFPKSVGEITIGYDQNDQVMEQQVTFAVNEWGAYNTNGSLVTN